MARYLIPFKGGKGINCTYFPSGETIVWGSFLSPDSKYHTNFEKLNSLLNLLQIVSDFRSYLQDRQHGSTILTTPRNQTEVIHLE